ncbi:tetratricopeptide repeat protein [Sphingomicrobium astaxanthinifaciens]|uniref:tetratricopeptide repeat protein n=1 Tax=Sphingomicrobium astaxanthinifaciens TaxID=1227949 RepID=UPI001FCB9334|nr:tetratricopeptide repeat protein [Sphingomicrobium astaxanthinifaciens]MCJ7421618.1 tetratricopeptide repeat protein [Sphingomicrobium astaxanthinifaciens]
MALPPQDAASFEREVDEEYRRAQAAQFGQKYGKWIALAVILFLAAVAGAIWWQGEQVRKGEAGAEELAKVVADLGDPAEADTLAPRLEALATREGPATAAAATMLRAAVLLERGDRAGAIEAYRALAERPDAPAPYAAAARIRWTYLDFDQVEPNVVIARLQGLAQDGQPFHGAAKELTALALLAQGQEEQAAQLFKTIAEDRSLPSSLRTRAVQVAGSYGADATAALAQLEQEGQ